MPHMLSLPSYICDTTDLLKHIDGIQVLWDSVLLTAKSFLMEQDHTTWPLNLFYNFYLLVSPGTILFLKNNFFCKPRTLLVRCPMPVFIWEPRR